MKKIVTLFVILTSTLLYSQNSGITYQAVLYNPSGEILPGNNNTNSVLSEKDICLRFSITDASSTTEYQETQKVRTDLFGMVNLVVGTGNQVGGYAANFDAILWNSSNKNLKVEIDITGTCSAFIVVSDQKFSAVPFAYASKVAENVSGIVAIANGGTGSNSVSGAKTNLGLNNIDNTSDLNKPISLAAQTALNTKENAANKSTNASLGTSDVLFPTQNAVKTYVDNQISTGVVDADTIIKGKIKIAGDIAGTADMPVIAANAVNATKIANGAVTDAKIASVSSSKIIGAIPVTQINGAVSKVNGVLPYGDGSVVIPFGMVRTGTLALRPAVGTTTNGDIYVVSGDSNTNNNGLTYISDGATWNEVTPNQASLDARYLKLGGGTMSGNIVVPSGKFISVADAPTLATDVPNKAYVDSMITGGATADATTTSLGKIKLAGDLTGTADAPTITNSAVIGKVLTGYSAAAGTVVATDNILQAIQKVDGNVALKQDNIALGTTSEYFRGDKTWRTLDKAAVSLTNVDNTSDANKPVSTATQTALDVKVDKVSGKGLSTEDYTTAEKTKLDGIEAEAEKNVNADWNATTGDAQILNKPTIPSIAGLATETFVNDGLALKANLASPTFTGTVSGITKAMVGLANADNTSDANKPVSTATQTALDLKANLASPTFTGDATAATAGAGDNDTSIATTAFVSTAITNAATPNASTTTLGKIQLGGDLAGPSSTASLPIITNGAITTLKLADNAVTNAKLGETISVENGGTGANMSTTAGYVKQATTGANLTTVSTIPVAHVDGAVRKVNGVEPDATGNVATMLGRVFRGSELNPNDATSIQNAPSGKQQSDIYIVASSSNINNGRTFIYDGTTWLEVATNLSTTDARYVNVAGDTMEGNLTIPTGTKIILADAPTNATDAANKDYVDGLVSSSATLDATDLIKGKIKLAGDLGGTAAVPTVPGLALKAPLESPSLTGTPLAPTAAAGTNNEQIATTAFVTAATAGKQDAITLITTGTGAASLSGSTLNIPTPSQGSPFFLANTTNDAGVNKTSAISRDGSIIVNSGFVRANSGNYSLTMNAAEPLGPRFQLGTTSGSVGEFFEFGAYDARNNFDTKARDLTFFSTAAANMLHLSHATGRIGLNTTAPVGRLIVDDRSYIGSLPLNSTSLMDNSTFRPHTRFQNTVGINNNGLSIFSTTGAWGMQSHNYSTGVPLPLVLQPAGGNVGIGTNNPQNNLDVVGGFNLRNTTGLSGSNFGMEFNTNGNSPRIDWVYNGAYTGSFAGDADFFFRLQNSRVGAGGFRFMTNPSGTAVERMTILNNGNVGIGTSTPSFGLDMQGANAGLNILRSGGVDAFVRLQSGAINTTISQIRSTPTGNLNFTTNDVSTRMTITQSGNVGIGTTTPSTTLHIQHPLLATASINADAQVLRLSRTTTPSSKWDNIAQFNLGSYSTAIAANSRLDLALTNGGNTTDLSNIMTWQANGNVGINNTAPSAPLVVQGVSGTGSLKLIAPSVASGDNWWMGFGHGTTSTDANDRARIGAEIISGGAGRLFFTTGLANAQTRAMFIDESQRVGIGTSTPVARLDVISGTTDVARFTTSLSTTNYAGIGIGNGSGTWAKIAAGNDRFEIRNFTSDAVFLNIHLGNGNIGVGTTNPTSKFEVNGSATNTAAFNSGSATSILFNNSNLAYTTANPGAFNLQGMKDGGTYTLAVQGTTSGTASFSGLNPTNVAFVFKSINNGTTIAGKDTLYTFVVMGTTVYVYMATGF